MQIVGIQHARELLERRGHVLDGDALWHAFHQHVQGFSHESPGGVQDERCNDKGRNGVGPAPSEKVNHDARGHGADASQGVGHDVQPGATNVEVTLTTPAEDHQVRQVDRETTRCDREHQTALYFRRIGETLPGLSRDQHGKGNECGAVCERGKNLGPVKTVGTLRGGRALRQGHCHHREAECGCVGKHVPGVGEQGQGVGCEAPDDFGNHVRGRERKRHGQSSTVALDIGAAGMMVVVPHSDRLPTTPPSGARSSLSSR